MISYWVFIYFAAVFLFLVVFICTSCLLFWGKPDTRNYWRAKGQTVLAGLGAIIIPTTFILMLSMQNNFQWWQVFILLLGLVGIVLALVGIQKRNKILTTTAFLFFLLVFGITAPKNILTGITTTGSPENTLDNKVAGSDTLDEAASVQAGKEVFLKNCIACHGEDGRKGVMGAFDLSQSTLPKDQRLAVITQGRNAMPTFNTQLTPKQINDVANYITLLRN